MERNQDQKHPRRVASPGPVPGPGCCHRVFFGVSSRVRFARASVRRGGEALPRRAGGAALDPASNGATCCPGDGWGTSAARQPIEPCE